MKKLSFLCFPLIFSLVFSLWPQATEEKPDTISAKAAIVMDAATGAVIFEKNADERRSMASTTKIMTTLLVLEEADLQQKIVTTQEMVTVEGSGMGLLSGDTVTFEGLCYGMMLSSGNDAANTAAIALAGSISAFGDKMNRKAAALGMQNTHFVTPSGLDAENHYSTAYDMALLTAAALENPLFCQMAKSPSATVFYGNPPYRRTLKNHNRLLTSYEGCIGVKTGFTKKSGRCLVSAATRKGATLICVTLSSPDDWNDHKKLLDYGFSQMVEKKFTPKSLSLSAVGGTQNHITVEGTPIILSVPKEAEEKLTTQIHLPPFVYAPITADTPLGEFAVMYEGRVVASTPFIAKSSVAQNTYRPNIFVRIWQTFLRLFC